MGKPANVHDAVKNDDVLSLQAMIQQGTKINDADQRHSFTPLHWAAQYGSLECTHWLLWHHADTMTVTPDGWTPAHIAAIRGSNTCIQALASSNADLDAVDSRGRTPAMLAASHGNSYTLQSILRRGVIINAKDNYGWNASHAAAYHGRVGCLQVLNKWGANLMEVDQSGNTPCHLAASQGHLQSLKLIISSSGNIEGNVKARNDQGETPLDLAQDHFKEDCVDYLNGIDVAYPAHVAAYKGDWSYLETLVSTGVVSINERDDRNSTPSHKAAGNGQIETLRWLQDHGANSESTKVSSIFNTIAVSIVNSNGETPKDVARRFGKLACVQLLGGDDLLDIENQDDNEELYGEIHLNNGNVNPSKSLEAKSRAHQKVKELTDLLQKAKFNYKQLGGILKEDKHFIELEKEQQRVNKELEVQLTYERQQREEMEGTMDQLRAKIHTLKLEVNDLLQRNQSLLMRLQSPVPPKGKPKRCMTAKRKEQGVFLVRKSSLT